MKIYFLKTAALEFLKANIKTLYPYYFQREDNSWIKEEFGDEPFEYFTDIPDFQLATLNGRPAGEIDYDNCKIVYENLRQLSESQASDERLWAGLCNGVFYQYMRNRWKYDTLDLGDPEKDYKAILSRFFFSGSARSGLYRNTLAKSWWVGRATYDSKNDDHFWALDVLGTNDLSSKISDIFYSNTFASNPEILLGIFNALRYFKENGIFLPHKEITRPAIRYLNAVGGAVLLDCLSSEEIEKIVKSKIIERLQGRHGALVDNLGEDDYEELDVSQEEENETTTFNPELVETLDLDTETPDSKPEYITYGCVVYVLREETGDELTYRIPVQNDTSRDLYLIEKNLLGKEKDYRLFLSGSHYKVLDFDWADEE